MNLFSLDFTFKTAARNGRMVRPLQPITARRSSVAATAQTIYPPVVSVPLRADQIEYIAPGTVATATSISNIALPKSAQPPIRRTARRYPGQTGATNTEILTIIISALVGASIATAFVSTVPAIGIGAGIATLGLLVTQLISKYRVGMEAETIITAETTTKGGGGDVNKSLTSSSSSTINLNTKIQSINELSDLVQTSRQLIFKTTRPFKIAYGLSLGAGYITTHFFTINIGVLLPHPGNFELNYLNYIAGAVLSVIIGGFHLWHNNKAKVLAAEEVLRAQIRGECDSAIAALKQMESSDRLIRKINQSPSDLKTAQDTLRIYQELIEGKDKELGQNYYIAAATKAVTEMQEIINRNKAAKVRPSRAVLSGFENVTSTARQVVDDFVQQYQKRAADVKAALEVAVGRLTPKGRFPALPAIGATFAVGKPPVTYTLKEQIAVGGMGVVFRAEDSAGNLKAFKFVDLVRYHDGLKDKDPNRKCADLIYRTNNEFKTLQRVSPPRTPHRNINPAEDTNIDSGIVNIDAIERLFNLKHPPTTEEERNILAFEVKEPIFVISPFLPKKTGSSESAPNLFAYFTEKKDSKEVRAPLNQQQIADIFLPILNGVIFLHDNGVYHRDLKPKNILVTEDGRGIARPVIIDLGIARYEHIDGPTRTTDAAISIGYCAPLIYQNKATADTSDSIANARLDIFSCGILLYELAIGGRMDIGQWETWMKNSGSNLITVPDYLQPILIKALAPIPSANYRSMKEFKEALEQALSGTVKSSSREAKPS
ncbi:protein kinase, partial [Candidatus Saganbacteria bacterium]|nr:protein kinase [Candidatus Saganbacteria bacterium]